jgi:hypothetical protein
MPCHSAPSTSEFSAIGAGASGISGGSSTELFYPLGPFMMVSPGGGIGCPFTSWTTRRSLGFSRERHRCTRRGLNGPK